MIVWCTITVTIMSSGLPWVTETAAKGIVKKETEIQYLVDFSEYAQEKDYYGDYKNRLVLKDECVKE